MQHSARGSQPSSRGYATQLVDLDTNVFDQLIDWLCSDFEHQMSEHHRFTQQRSQRGMEIAAKQMQALRAAATTLLFVIGSEHYHSLNGMLRTQTYRNSTSCGPAIICPPTRHYCKGANRDVDMVSSDGRMWQLSHRNYTEFAKTVDWLVSEAAKRPLHTQ